MALAAIASTTLLGRKLWMPSETPRSHALRGNAVCDAPRHERHTLITETPNTKITAARSKQRSHAARGNEEILAPQACDLVLQTTPQRSPAVKINTADLTLGRLNEVLSPTDSHGMIRVIDDSGEDYLYPAELFNAVEVQEQTVSRLHELLAA